MTHSHALFATPEDVEAAFYTAFSQCDIAAMQKLWAHDAVVCVHPGSHAISGYSAVLRSWAYIFDGAELPDIQLKLVSRHASEGLAVHVMQEHIATGEKTTALLLATNVYRKYADGWLMVEHHGSMVQSQQVAHTVQ